MAKGLFAGGVNVPVGVDLTKLEDGLREGNRRIKTGAAKMKVAAEEQLKIKPTIDDSDIHRKLQGYVRRLANAQERAMRNNAISSRLNGMGLDGGTVFGNDADSRLFKGFLAGEARASATATALAATSARRMAVLTNRVQLRAAEIAKESAPAGIADRAAGIGAGLAGAADRFFPGISGLLAKAPGAAAGLAGLGLLRSFGASASAATETYRGSIRGFGFAGQRMSPDSDPTLVGLARELGDIAGTRKSLTGLAGRGVGAAIGFATGTNPFERAMTRAADAANALTSAHLTRKEQWQRSK